MIQHCGYPMAGFGVWCIKFSYLRRVLEDKPTSHITTCSQNTKISAINLVKLLYTYRFQIKDNRRRSHLQHEPSGNIIIHL